MKRATDMMRPNLRRKRAEALAAAILSKIDPYLSDAHSSRRDACNAILELLEDDGIEVLSDYDRQTHHLPPRGPDGWTIQEIAALEKMRLKLLTQPFITRVTLPQGEDE